MKPRAIDLFSGCGGLTLGLKRAGFDVVGAVEIDALASETYRLNHRKPFLWQEDIRELSVNTVKRKLGIRKWDLDLLAGCPPCQGFSSMTTLNGSSRVRDRRNALVFEFLRFVDELMPRAVMMENVPGLATDYRMAKLKTGLRRLGYTVAVDVLNAADYGVPQRRRRLILLAALDGPLTFAHPVDGRKTVREAIAALDPPGDTGDELHDFPENRGSRIQNLIRRIPKNGGSRKDLGARSQLQCHRDCDGFKDVYGRMSWDEVSPTITGGCVNPSKGRFLHPEQDRCVTLREAALLQGFPPKYRFSLRRGKFAAAEMIGNALPPEFVRLQAQVVKRHLCQK